MSEKIPRISRRTALKGIGVTMFLPLLEAMESPTAGASTAKQGSYQPPVRLAALYMPNGVNPHSWSPTGFGSNFQLSPILAPLANVKSEILVLEQLMNKASIEGDGHYVKVAPFLTGTAITKTTGSNLRCGGISLDQYIAQRIGNMTPMPSLELSVEPPTTYIDTNVGYTALYGSHISWNTPTTPVTRDLDPQAAFNRIFRRQTGPVHAHPVLDMSVLDAVQEDARSLQNQVGKADRQKLAEYFEAVRSVEKRISFDAQKRRAQVMDDPIARVEVEKLGGRIHDYYTDAKLIRDRGIDHTGQIRLMMDIMVLAFWTDTTRVATFMFGNEVSGRNFSFIPGVSGSHHEISHHSGEKAKLEEYQRINIWHMTQYAYMLERMHSIREGNGTLLDNSMVLIGSGMKDGNEHSPFNLPIVLAGRGGGKIASGRRLVYTQKTPLCNLYCSMLQAMGLPAGRFGDSTGELKGIHEPGFNGVSA